MEMDVRKPFTKRPGFGPVRIPERVEREAVQAKPAKAPKPRRALRSSAAGDARAARERVYFVQMVLPGDIGGPIKIGFAADVPDRLRQLQTASPYEIRLIVSVPGGESREVEIHNRLQAARIRGEWFQPKDSVLNEMRAMIREAEIEDAWNENATRDALARIGGGR